MQTEFFKTESGRQPRRRGGNSATDGAAAHPIAEIRHQVHAIDKVQADPAQKFTAVLFKNSKAVPFTIRR